MEFNIIDVDDAEYDPIVHDADYLLDLLRNDLVNEIEEAKKKKEQQAVTVVEDKRRKVSIKDPPHLDRVVVYGLEEKLFKSTKPVTILFKYPFEFIYRKILLSFVNHEDQLKGTFTVKKLLFEFKLTTPIRISTLTTMENNYLPVVDSFTWFKNGVCLCVQLLTPSALNAPPGSSKKLLSFPCRNIRNFIKSIYY